MSDQTGSAVPLLLLGPPSAAEARVAPGTEFHLPAVGMGCQCNRECLKSGLSQLGLREVVVDGACHAAAIKAALGIPKGDVGRFSGGGAGPCGQKHDATRA